MTVLKCGDPMRVRCPEEFCALVVTVDEAIYSEPRRYVGLHERWSEPAALLAWVLSCGHVVDPAVWALRIDATSDAGIARWFSPKDDEPPWSPPGDAVWHLFKVH